MVFGFLLSQPQRALLVGKAIARFHALTDFKVLSIVCYGFYEGLCRIIFYRHVGVRQLYCWFLKGITPVIQGSQVNIVLTFIREGSMASPRGVGGVPWVHVIVYPRVQSLQPIPCPRATWWSRFLH